MKETKHAFVALLIFALLMGCTSTSWQLRSGRIDIKEGRYEGALVNLDKEIQRLEENPEAWYLKGYAYEKLRNWSAMTEAYAKSLSYSDQFKTKIESNRFNLMEQFYGRFKVEFDSSNFEVALAQIDTAIIIDPQNTMLYNQAAIAAYSGDYFERTVEYGIAAIDREEEDSTYLDTRRLLLTSYSTLNNYDELIKWAKEVMNNTDTQVEQEANYYLQALDEIILAYEAKEQAQDAENAIREAIEKFPEMEELKTNLATILIRRDDLEEAMVILLKVLESDPDDVYANLTVGIMLVNQKKYTESIPYLEKVLLHEPENIKAVQSLVGAYHNSGQETKGNEMLGKYKSLQAK